MLPVMRPSLESLGGDLKRGQRSYSVVFFILFFIEEGAVVSAIIHAGLQSLWEEK